MRSGTFLKNAQGRAQRRKSAWNLLLPLFALPLWLGFFSAFVAFAWYCHVAMYPEDAGLWRQFAAHGNGNGLACFLILIPSLMAAIFPAFVMTNFLVHLIPPARRALDREAGRFPGTGYRSSQRALIKGGAIAVALAAILGVVGAAIGGVGVA